MHWGNYGGGGRSGVKPLPPKTGKNSVKFLIEIQKINIFEIFTWKTPMKNSWLRLWPYASIGFRAEQTKNPNLIINRLPLIFSCIDSKKTIELPPITHPDSPRLNVGYRSVHRFWYFVYLHSWNNISFKNYLLHFNNNYTNQLHQIRNYTVYFSLWNITRKLFIPHLDFDFKFLITHVLMLFSLLGKSAS